MSNAESGPEATLGVACMLSLSGGFVDAFTYVGHGGVFANAMTGNVVLLGVFTAAGDWRQAFNHIPPIVAFLVGVVVAQAIRLPHVGTRWPALLALILEISVLAAITFLPRTFPDIWIVLSISFAAAVQNSSFARVLDWTYNSVMTTGNLRRFSEALFAALLPGRSPEMSRQVQVFGLICLSFLDGALIGGLLTPWLGNVALWVPVAVMLAALALTAYPHKIARGGDIQAPS
jgi:uncharacterized membrane protein YoaK (UPF0700 family)